ncbi:hypothetical protein D9615_006251 [Tricholomella constricta]|uniref:Uncharacterized protein n=1 Tax=Tricholomella constricta TaxID=117010 RepID=A0A8H5HB53_9AGAR|nr:hypothetical protein D9615_006251 [Tricholomella constricta]
MIATTQETQLLFTTLSSSPGGRFLPFLRSDMLPSVIAALTVLSHFFSASPALPYSLIPTAPQTAPLFLSPTRTFTASPSPTLAANFAAVETQPFHLIMISLAAVGGMLVGAGALQIRNKPVFTPHTPSREPSGDPPDAPSPNPSHGDDNNNSGNGSGDRNKGNSDDGGGGGGPPDDDPDDPSAGSDAEDLTPPTPSLVLRNSTAYLLLLIALYTATLARLFMKAFSARTLASLLRAWLERFANTVARLRSRSTGVEGVMESVLVAVKEGVKIVAGASGRGEAAAPAVLMHAMEDLPELVVRRARSYNRSRCHGRNRNLSRPAPTSAPQPFWIPRALADVITAHAPVTTPSPAPAPAPTCTPHASRLPQSLRAYFPSICVALPLLQAVGVGLASAPLEWGTILCAVVGFVGVALLVRGVIVALRPVQIEEARISVVVEEFGLALSTPIPEDNEEDTPAHLIPLPEDTENDFPAYLVPLPEDAEDDFPAHLVPLPGDAEDDFPEYLIPLPEDADDDFPAYLVPLPEDTEDDFPAHLIPLPEDAEGDFPAYLVPLPDDTEDDFPAYLVSLPEDSDDDFPAYLVPLPDDAEDDFPAYLVPLPEDAEDDFPAHLVPLPDDAEQDFLAYLIPLPEDVEDDFPAYLVPLPDDTEDDFPAYLVPLPDDAEDDFPAYLAPLPDDTEGDFPAYLIPLPEDAEDAFPAHLIPLPKDAEDDFPAHLIPLPEDAEDDFPAHLIPLPDDTEDDFVGAGFSEDEEGEGCSVDSEEYADSTQDDDYDYEPKLATSESICAYLRTSFFDNNSDEEDDDDDDAVCRSVGAPAGLESARVVEQESRRIAVVDWLEEEEYTEEDLWELVGNLVERPEYEYHEEEDATDEEPDTLDEISARREAKRGYRKFGIKDLIGSLKRVDGDPSFRLRSHLSKILSSEEEIECENGAHRPLYVDGVKYKDYWVYVYDLLTVDYAEEVRQQERLYRYYEEYGHEDAEDDKDDDRIGGYDEEEGYDDDERYDEAVGYEEAESFEKSFLQEASPESSVHDLLELVESSMTL